jgi:hypothetical protein
MCVCFCNTFTVFCLCTYLYCFVVILFFLFCSCFVVIVVLCIFIFVCTSVGLLPPGESPIAVSNNDDDNKNFSWETMDHPLYSPDLALGDLHITWRRNKQLTGNRFHCDVNVKRATITWVL